MGGKQQQITIDVRVDPIVKIAEEIRGKAIVKIKAVELREAELGRRAENVGEIIRS